MINEMLARANQIIGSKNSKEDTAKRISAEFHAAAYVSKGKLWVSYRNEKGVVQTQVLA